MEWTLLHIVLITGGYLLGSIASAVVVSRLMRLPDPRSQGSGNPGATNVLRVGGKKAGALTLLGDVIKGALAVGLAYAVGVPFEIVVLCGLAAFFGHLYPVFFGFKGGKGVATALGVLLAAAWPVGLATAATWLGMTLLFRISSLSALIAFALAPLYVWWLKPVPLFVAVAIIMSLMLFWRHRSNIRNLLSGAEERIQGP